MNKTCNERIDLNLESRIKDMKKIIKAENPIEELNNEALSLTKTEVYKLELSWGGPSDYFTFEYNPENKELISIEYHFLDWFDGAKRNIPYNSREWDILEELFYNCILIE